MHVRQIGVNNNFEGEVNSLSCRKINDVTIRERTEVPYRHHQLQAWHDSLGYKKNCHTKHHYVHEIRVQEYIMSRITVYRIFKNIFKRSMVETLAVLVLFLPHSGVYDQCLYRKPGIDHQYACWCPIRWCPSTHQYWANAGIFSSKFLSMLA